MFSDICNLISIFAILYSTNIILRNWKNFPDRVPIHFGLTGKPDNYGSKYFMFLYPVMCLFFFILYTFIIKIDTTMTGNSAVDFKKLSDIYTMDIVKTTVILTFSVLSYYVTDLIINKKENLGKALIIILISVVSIMAISSYLIPSILHTFIK